MPIPQDARHIANQQGDFVPQHQNSFLIEIAGLEGDAKDLIVLALKNSALPTEQSQEVAIPYGNEIRYVAGKTEYEQIPLVVHDYVDRKVRKAIMDWRKQVYDQATGNVGLPSQYKKTADIILQASNGTLPRVCRIHGVWPQKVEGGNLDMSSADVVLVSVTLRYDRVEWKL